MSTDNLAFVVNLDDENATVLDLVGGKGANLALLYQRNFSVPNAFIITTHTYEYIINNKQIQTILSTLDQINTENIQELENISEHIKTIICNITLPDSISDLIIKFYNKLREKTNQINLHVAVRSSATAEDLPENSFAGQQDTYLHVTNENLIEKIKQCWASLFTARAISYRKKSNIDHKMVKLAVVIQEMVSSDVSGVAFTANPITGLRNEVIIDSTYGLGEALVSGLVTPDHYEILVNQNPEIRVKNIGEKGIHIKGKSYGGTETIITNDQDKKLEALSDQYILQLALLAKQIEKSYNYQPQDLEWGFKNGHFFILQARPITTLFPVPNYTYNQTELKCMVSFGTIQGFLEPMTPLGESTIRTLLSNFLRKVGANQTSTIEDDISSNPSRYNILKSSANRIWIDITGILTSPVRKVFGLSMIDTGMGKIVNHLNRSNIFPLKSIFSSLKLYFSLLLFFIPLLLRSIRNLIFPRYAKNLYLRQMDKYHQFLDKGFSNPHNQTFTHCVDHFMNVLTILPSTLVKYVGPCLAPSAISIKLLEKLSKSPMDVLALTRAVESNPTTDMNLILWKITVLVRQNVNLLKLFENERTDTLVHMYKNKSFESILQYEIEEFFRIYGCRGIGEIDLGRPRWSDQPAVVFDQIKNYLKIQNSDKFIDKIHDLSKQSAYESLNRIENQLKNSFIKRYLINFFFERLKILFSLRESPKFHGLIQTFGKCRQQLSKQAQIALQENFISNLNDIYFLYIEELKIFAYDVDNKQYNKIEFWKNLIEQRRIEYNKQMLCKRIPLVLLSNGMTYYDATTIPDDTENLIELGEGEYLGSPVSPGLYEGKVRIVDDPMNSQLQPGEILVCTATDPAWTSLFPIAGGLVLEMGGMLQHGAIVSREYGLPAVVGVANAKKIFHNGQVIQVNGSNGRIKVLSDL